MRQDDHLAPARQPDELRVDRRLVLEHVEPGAGQPAFPKHLDQRVLVDDVAARRVDDVGGRLHQRQTPRRQEMEGRRRGGAVHRNDVHPGQHLVEALPVGRLELVLDCRRHAVPVVIVDGQAECLGAAGDRRADAAHPHDAEALAPDAPAEHPGRRPACPSGGRFEDVGALGQPPRHRQHQCHRHVGGVLGQDVRRVGHRYAPARRRRHVDLVDAVSEIGDQLQIVARRRRSAPRRCGR